MPCFITQVHIVQTISGLPNTKIKKYMLNEFEFNRRELNIVWFNLTIFKWEKAFYCQFLFFD